MAHVEPGRGPAGDAVIKKVYQPPTLREACQAVASWEDFRVQFYDWLDDFYHYPGQRLLLIAAEIPPLSDQRLEAFAAAAVHQLCLDYGLPVPDWVYKDRFYLEDPWFYPPELNLRAIEIAESPAAFRARNIFTFANVLERW